jgi:hypothetical protein
VQCEHVYWKKHGEGSSDLLGPPQKGFAGIADDLSNGVEEQEAQPFGSGAEFLAGQRGADVLRASVLARSGDFPLRLAYCQGKHPIAETRRTALATSWFRGRARGAYLIAVQQPYSLP